MKKLLLLIIFFSTKVSAQEYESLLTDSLKINRVKSQTIKLKKYKCKGSTYYIHPETITRYFDTAALLTKCAIRMQYDRNPTLITRYYYDSLQRLYASRVTWDNSVYISGPGFYNHKETSVNMTTYYQYDSRNRLVRSFINNEKGQLTSEILHSYDPSVIVKKWYDTEGRLARESDEYYDRTNVLAKSSLKNFAVNGSVSNTQVFLHENSYNDKQQLIEDDFEIDGSAVVIKYEYQDNGLIKSKTGDAYSHNWEVFYKYY